MRDGLYIFGVGLLFAAALIICGFYKSWVYEECITVGHSTTYCAAQTAGCFGGK